MNTRERLIEIWEQDYINALPQNIKNRRFDYSKNTNKKDILITGINPSYNANEAVVDKCSDFDDIIYDRIEKSHYWYPVKKMIYDKDKNIDLRDKSSYLDLLYFRERDQKFLKKSILNTPEGIRFVADQINLTQHIIEDIIRPKVIIVKNKESSAYWGKLADKGIIWMGYQFEFIQNTPYGELHKIIGLIDSPERVAPEISKTNLRNSFVLFTQHINQYTPKAKRVTVEFIKALLECYGSE